MLKVIPNSKGTNLFLNFCQKANANGFKLCMMLTLPKILPSIPILYLSRVPKSLSLIIYVNILNSCYEIFYCLAKLFEEGILLHLQVLKAQTTNP